MLFCSVPSNSWLGICFKCEDQAAAVNAQLDGTEISVSSQHTVFWLSLDLINLQHLPGERRQRSQLGLKETNASAEPHGPQGPENTCRHGTVWLLLPDCVCSLSESESIQIKVSSGFSESLGWNCAPEVSKVCEPLLGWRRELRKGSGDFQQQLFVGSAQLSTSLQQ